MLLIETLTAFLGSDMKHKERLNVVHSSPSVVGKTIGGKWFMAD